MMVLPEQTRDRFAKARRCVSLLSGLAIAAATVMLTLASRAVAADDPAGVEFFEKKVRPLLADNCYNCHSADTNSMGGLRVDDRNGLVQGGGRGPAIVPGDPEKSRLIHAVRYTNEKLKMPPKKQLSAEEVAILTKWIADGAAWPEVKLPATVGLSDPEQERLRKTHWAWQPLSEPQPPAVRDGTWGRDDIDRFILARLEERGLQPVADAVRPALIRRVTFDLTGLPPSPEEIDAFVNDGSANAYEKVVDRLLASAAFGERWGRHWLDVARYGESTGSARNIPYPHAWRYRDYVIDAFNNDKPYDQFIREQIAGDLLPANSPGEKAEQLIATGFLALGVKDVNQRFKVRFIMDNVDEQIDTVTRSVLALTASCARCHDHKFDPIPTTDYYALAGIFRSTDLCAGVRNKMGGGGFDYYDSSMLLSIGLGPPPPVDGGKAQAEKVEEAKKSVAAARAEFQALRDNPEGDVKGPDGRPKRAIARQKLTQLEQQLFALTDPAASGQVAFGVRDSKTVSDTEIRVRGEAEKLGPRVPRGFLSVIPVPDQPAVNPRQSGRLELAYWLTSDKNPLTSRVMVNRIWQHLFGQGLVSSVDNFGATGDVPSHPALLDHLARRLIRDGWSVKKLVRAVALTRAYGLSSESAANMAIDPANRLVWRHSPRRLDAEEIRDAMLAAAGKLDLTRPKASPAKDFKVVELRNNGPEAKNLQNTARASLHRSVYLPLLRGLLPASLEVFDFAEQGMVTGSRDTTTVAPQALYLLNDPFVRQQSLALADRLLQRADLDDAGRMQWAYRLAMGRAAMPQELERATGYLGDYEAALREAIATANGAQPKSPADTAGAAAETPKTDTQGGGGTTDDEGKKKETPKKPVPAVPANPDDPVPGEDVVDEKLDLPKDPRLAAWASFCQALLAAGEFRYVK